METLKTFIKNFISNETERDSLLPTTTPSTARTTTSMSTARTTTSMSSFPQLPQRLTHKLYLDIRQTDSRTENYLEFIQKTYYQHFKDSLARSWICTKSSFYFFFQAFFPNLFQHCGSDLLIHLSETILDEYALIFEEQARSQTLAQTRNCTRNSRRH